MSFRPSRALIVSFALHAAGAFGVWMVAKNVVPVPQAPPPGLEFDFLEARRIEPPAPAPPPVAPAAQPVVAARTRPAMASARTAIRPTVTEPEPQPGEPAQSEPTGTVEPANTPPAPAVAATAPGTARILTASELYGNVDSLAGAAAAAGSIDLGRPGSGYRASRDLWGHPRGPGTELDRVRAVASAPTIAALAENNHMQPAGTMRHDRAASRRAEESFSPVRSIPEIGAALMRAPLRMVSGAQHVQSAGEQAAGAALDAAHSQSFTMNAVTTAVATCPPYHILRADIEVDQDVAGSILATRVVSPSRVAGFDEAAVRAIREALPESPTLNTGAGRRSRWSFEVSDAPAPVFASMCGNQGWRVAGDQSNGVRVRMRVRMIGAMNLNRGS